MLRGMPAKGDHQARLTAFYGKQAASYDLTRDRLLPGRRESMQDLASRLPDGAALVDLGGGTGSHLVHLGEAHQRLSRLDLVDLCPALLAKAQERVKERGWHHVHLHHADATTWTPSHPVDAVICSFSLTMIPAWWLAIDQAVRMLRPGGLLIVTDFTIAPRHGDATRLAHPAWMRVFWPWWFAHDGVRLNADHLPYLRHALHEVSCHEGFHRLPWIGLKVPYYRWVGRRP